MRVKFFLMFIVLLLAFSFSLANDEGYSIKEITDCINEGYNDCNLIVGNIYKFTEIESLPASVEIKIPSSRYSVDLIPCTDKNAITLAYYDGFTWQPLESDVNFEVSGTYFYVSAFVDFFGDFAIIIDEDNCDFHTCGEGKHFVTNPLDGEVQEGSNLEFLFCDVPIGCNIDEDGICDVNCPIDYDPDCAIGYDYSNDANDGCNPYAIGNVCDADCCYPGSYPNCIDSLDLDCQQDVISCPELPTCLDEDGDGVYYCNTLLGGDSLVGYEGPYDYIQQENEASLLAQASVHENDYYYTITPEGDGDELMFVYPVGTVNDPYWEPANAELIFDNYYSAYGLYPDDDGAYDLFDFEIHGPLSGYITFMGVCRPDNGITNIAQSDKRCWDPSGYEVQGISIDDFTITLENGCKYVYPEPFTQKGSDGEDGDFVDAIRATTRYQVPEEFLYLPVDKISFLATRAGDFEIFLRIYYTVYDGCLDADGDGYGAINEEFCQFSETDCNDNAQSINPGEIEICDNIDNDCDGEIDEGNICTKTLYVCDDLSCVDENSDAQILCSVEMEDEDVRCSYSVESEDAGYPKTFYSLVCGTGFDCFHYNTGEYLVCAEKETAGTCEDNLDNDCDGKIDYDDQDCLGACTEGACNLEENTWCDSLGDWVSDNYCHICGAYDSDCPLTCDEDVTYCQSIDEDSEQSSGCVEGACDYIDNRWCRNGAWDTEEYCNNCYFYDSECSSYGDCLEGYCDVENEVHCSLSAWENLGYDSRCSGVDADYESCVAGACDIEHNMYCNDGVWTNEDYCLNCGSKDFNCGTPVCEQDSCDTYAGQWCNEKEWTVESYCDGTHCGFASDPYNQDHCGGCTVTESPEETCNDGLDNDCDGYFDCIDPDCYDQEGCVCEDGSERQCGDSDIGSCEYGVQTCSNGVWGECEGAVYAEIEYCNTYDDDCDESIDEGCTCTEGETKNCGTDIGTCSAGVQYCDKGLWSICSGTTYSGGSEEVCDGVDNDCDGEIDEGCSCTEGANQTCGEDQGICTIGIQFCENGEWGECEGDIESFPEVCNDGIDNDCDGYIDDEDENCQVTENLEPTCYDAVQNQDEEGIDCGGSVCSPCEMVSCNDKLQNGDEEGVDCGGSSCPPCDGVGEEDSDGDGLTDEFEALIGTNSYKVDTDDDGIDDATDSMPLCPNERCDVTYGETINNCPEDCEGKASSSWFYFIVLLILLLVLAVLCYNYYRKKKSKKIIKEKKLKPLPGTQKLSMNLKQKKFKPTKLDKQLEESFKQAGKLGK